MGKLKLWTQISYNAVINLYIICINFKYIWMHIEFIHALNNIFIWDISIVKGKNTVFCGFERKPVHCSFLVGFFYKDLHSDRIKHTSFFL